MRILAGFVIRTGNPEHSGDILNNSTSVLLRKSDDIEFHNAANFNDRGTVHTSYNGSLEVDALRIQMNETSQNWLIINEIHIITGQ